MNSKNYYRTVFSILISLALAIPSLLATDGYFGIGYGAKAKGLAGAGVGLYQYSLIGGNPAGNVFLGNQYDLGISIFMPSRQYTITGNPSGIPGFFGLTPGTVESDSKMFPVPHLGANWMLNQNSALGVALFGNGGMNTNYPTHTFYDESVDATGVNMAQMFLATTYSRKLNNDHSIGLTGIIAYQYFKAEGVSSFANFSSDPASLSNNGTDSSFGFGFKVGYMGTFAEKLHIGAQFQSKVFMSEFSEYAGLFAEQGDFDVPMNWTVGIAYDVTEALTIAFDVKQIYYSGVASVGNPMDLMTNAPTDQMGNPNPNFQPLGFDDAWGFGWEDMTIYKVGLEYEMNTDWTLRAGYSYGKQPIPESEVLFNILAPGVMEGHIAFGIGKKLAGGNSIDFFFNYALNSSVTGYNPLDFDPVALQQGQFVPNQEIELEMSQIDFGIGYSF